MHFFHENDIDKIHNNIYLGNFQGANKIINNNIYNINIIINFYKIKLDTNNTNIIYYHLPYSFNDISINECWDLIINIIKITNQYYGQNILFCCKRGHHRSASAVLLYLILHKKCTYEEGVKYIKSIRKHSLNRNGNMPIALRYYSKLINKIYS
jgi:hypothetical protein